jgi:hypothetical protein
MADGSHIIRLLCSCCHISADKLQEGGQIQCDVARADLVCPRQRLLHADP